jgi:hypothetical protein
MTPPTEEEYIAWRDHPVTQWILTACEAAAEENKASWVALSWEGNSADPAALLEMKTRADAYRALAQTSYDGWLETMERYHG